MTKRRNRSAPSGILLIIFPLLLLIYSSIWASPLTPEEEFAEGLALYKKTDFTQALKAFQKFEKEHSIHPLRPEALFMQGQALRALARWPEAGQAFSRAAGSHSILSDYALYYQGEAFHLAGERQKSLEIFQRLASLHPQSLRVPQAELKVAELYLQSAEYSQAAEVCENLLRKGPRKDFPAQALLLLGQARERLGQWPEAVKTYQELWLRYPLHPLSKEAKAAGDSLAKEKKLPGGKVPPEALFARALQFYRAHLHEGGLREMEGIEGFPPNAYPGRYAGERWIDDLYLYRGISLFRLKRYPKAAEVFNLVVRHSQHEEMAERSLFWRARTLFRMDREKESLKALSVYRKKYPRGSSLDQALYLEARICQERKEISRAVSIYREIAERFPHSALRFPAIWQSGWLLFREKDIPGALRAWDHLQALNPNSPWMEKVLYWKGRASEGMGRAREAEENYHKLLKNYPASYYGVLAATPGGALMSGKGRSIPLHDRPRLPFLGLKPQAAAPRSLHLEKGRFLTRLGFLSLAMEELEAAEEEGRAAEETLMEISHLYREVGEYYRSAALVRKNFNIRPLAGRPSEDRISLYLLAYPFGNESWINHYAKDRNLDPALLCAVILEESQFNPQAISPAGARGLMQVLPSTAQQLVQQMKVHPYSDKLLFDPGMNLRLGSFYLTRLLEEFGGREILALAAYNAGPQLVREWMANTPSARDDEFLENIPYAETRNYVIRVVGSARVYRLLYGGSKDPGNP